MMPVPMRNITAYLKFSPRAGLLFCLTIMWGKMRSKHQGRWFSALAATLLCAAFLLSAREGRCATGIGLTSTNETATGQGGATITIPVLANDSFTPLANTGRKYRIKSVGAPTNGGNPVIIGTAPDLTGSAPTQSIQFTAPAAGFNSTAFTYTIAEDPYYYDYRVFNSGINTATGYPLSGGSSDPNWTFTTSLDGTNWPNPWQSATVFDGSNCSVIPSDWQTPLFGNAAWIGRNSGVGGTAACTSLAPNSYLRFQRSFTIPDTTTLNIFNAHVDAFIDNKISRLFINGNLVYRDAVLWGSGLNLNGFVSREILPILPGPVYHPAYGADGERFCINPAYSAFSNVSRVDCDGGYTMSINPGLLPGTLVVGTNTIMIEMFDDGGDQGMLIESSSFLDGDKDGVKDGNDQCPDSPAAVTVDTSIYSSTQGCAIATATVTVNEQDLRVTKTASTTTPTVGTPVTYTVSVGAPGPVAIPVGAATVTDTIDLTKFNVTVITPSAWTCSVKDAANNPLTLPATSGTGTATITCTNNAIIAGSLIVPVTALTINVTPRVTGAFTNQATITGDGGTPNTVTCTGTSPVNCGQATLTVGATPPTLQLTKTSTNGTGTFTYNLTNPAKAGDTLVTSGATPASTSRAYLAGSISTGTAITINEVGVPAGWPANPAAASCTDSNSVVTGNTGSFGTLAGSTLTIPAAYVKDAAQFVCTFTNTQIATVTVVKSLTPASDPGTFDLKVGAVVVKAAAGNANGLSGTTTVAANTATTVSEVGAGTTSLAGYYTPTWSCTGAYSGSGSGASIPLPALAPNAATTCTFSNRRLPTVQVQKNSLNGTATFAYALTNLAAATDSISTSTTGVTVAGVVSTVTNTAGNVTITETAPPGWPVNPVAASCVDINGTVSGNGSGTFATLAGSTLTVVPGFLKDGAQIVCTYTNDLLAPVSITMDKILSPTGDTGTFDLKVGNAVVRAAAGNGGTGTTSVAANVAVTLSETGAGGANLANYLTSWSCSGGYNAIGNGASFTIPAINMAAGSATTCTLTNGRKPTVQVIANSTNGTGTFGYTLTNSTNTVNDSITTITAGTSVAGAVSTISFPASNATVTEAPPGGWPAPASASCVDTNGAVSGNGAGSFGSLAGSTLTIPPANLRNGAQIVCTFTNTLPAPHFLDLVKTLGANRINNNDQFVVQIKNGATVVVSNGAGTTGSGAAVGNSSTGSVSLTYGTPYTVTEVMAAGSISTLPQYATTISCTNSFGASSTVLPTGAGQSFPLSPIPGDAITCTLSNTPAPPQITLVKTLGGTGRVFSADQFTMQIKNGAAVVNNTTNSTTGGAAAAVTPGTGTTGATTVGAGTSYTLTEVGAGGANLNQYTTAITCTNSLAGSLTSLPSGAGQSFTVTPVPGDNISCTLTNTPIMPQITLVKAMGGLGRGTDTDQFTMQVLNGAAVINDTTNSTTAGAGTIVTPGSGTTGSTQVFAGSSYNLTEVAAGSSTLSNYNTAIGCSNSYGSSLTTLPSGSGQSFSVIPGPADNITCTLTNTPKSPLITVMKTLAGNRVADTDEFTMLLKNASNTVLNSTTFSTSAGAGSTVSPLTGTTGATLVTAGQTYTLDEAASGTTNLAQYTATILCTNKNGGGTSPAFTITPTAGALINCVITNTPKAPQITLVKALGASRISATDQFTVQIKNGAAVVSNTTNSTSTGVSSTVTGGTGTTGVTTVAIGTVYTLTEAASGTTTLTNYASSISCTNSLAGSTTALPSGVGQNFNITPGAGDNITCTLTNTAPQITLVKSLGSVSRFSANDEFTVQIKNGVTVVNSTANSTTTGSGSTVTNGTGTTGVTTVAIGTAYSLTEVAASGGNLTNYASSISCTNSNGGSATVLPTGAGQSFSVTPAAGDNLTCTLTNIANKATIALSKASPLGGNRVQTNDQFTMQIKNGVTVVNSTANSTTKGAFAAVTAGTGATGAYAATVGTTYTLTEVGAGAPVANLSQYATIISCSNSFAGSTTVLPSGSGQSFTVTPQAGDSISCTLDNSPAAPVITLIKSLGGVSRISDLDEFDVKIMNGANPVASNNSGNGTAGTGSTFTVGTFTAGPYTATMGTTYTLTEAKHAGPSALTLYSNSISCSNGLAGSSTVLPSGFGSSFSLTPAAGDNISCTFTNTARANVQIIKNSTNDTGTFSYALTNASNTPESIATVTAGAPVTGLIHTVTAIGTAVVITETPLAGTGWPTNPVSITCINTTTGTTVASVTNSSSNAITIPANQPTGAEIVCTFTNTKPVITVTKNLLPAGDTGTFNLLVGGNPVATAVGNGGTGNAIASAGSAVTVSETAAGGTNPSDYTTTYSCTGGVTIAGAGTSVSITPPTTTALAGQATNCTFTNTRKATITVVKSLAPGADPGTFDLSIGGTVVKASAGNGGSGSTQVTAGAAAVNVTISETAAGATNPANYLTSTYSCNDSPPTSGNGTSFSLPASSLTAGANITCTFTNNRNTTISVIKNVVPASDPGAFNLLVGGTTVATAVSNNGSGSTTVAANTGTPLTINETGAAGTALTDYISTYSCNDAPNTHGSGTTFSLPAVSRTAGGNVTCTFTNNNRPQVQVQKISTNGTGTFTYALTNLAAASDSIATTVAGTAVNGVINLVTSTASSVTIAETAPAGWPTSPVTASCVDVNGTASGNGAGTFGTLAGNTLTINSSYLLPGAQILCNFTNTKPTVQVRNTSNNGTGAFNYAMTNLASVNDSITTTVAGTPVNGATTIVTAPGTAVTIAETPPASWPANPATASCTDANGAVSGNGAGTFGTLTGSTLTIPAVDLRPAAVIVCSFTNSKPTVQVSKTSINGTGTFTYALTNLAALNDNITTVVAGTPMNGATSIVTAAGSAVTIAETPSAGWPANPVAASCIDNNAAISGNPLPPTTFGSLVGNTLTIPSGNLLPAAQIFCMFINTKPTVQVQKTSTNGTGTFGYILTNLASANDSITTATAATPVNGSTNVVTAAGTAVTIAESVPAGWPAYPASASCIDNNAAVSGNPPPPTTFGSPAANILTIPTANLRPAAQILCTFKNTLPQPTVQLRKTSNNATGAFTYAMTNLTAGSDGITTAVAGTPVSGATNNVSSTGTSVTVTETVPAGWPANPVSAVCVDNNGTVSGNGAGSLGSLTGNVLTILPVNLRTGAQIVCSFVNTAVATITVNKALAPVSDSGKFNLLAGATTVATNVGNGGTGSTSVPANTAVTVSETAGTLTSLANYATTYSCTNGSAGSGTSIGITPTPGQAVTCTFTNNRLATVTIVKQSNGGTGSFTFSGGTNGLPASLTLDTTTGNPKSSSVSTVTALNTATAITETVPAGWALNAASTNCTDGSSTFGTLAAGMLTIPAGNVTAGKNITCTFTNDKYATITVNKALLPSSDSGKFNLLVGATAVASNVGDTGTGNTTVPANSAVTVSETAGTSTSLANYDTTYTCTGGYTATNVSGTSISIPAGSVTPGSATTCTFTNSRKATVTLQKNIAARVIALDQFALTVTDVTVSTTGSITGLQGVTATKTVAGGTAVSLSEAISGTSTLLSQYSQTITCTNTLAGSPTVLPSGAVASFPINLTPVAGDNITCIITNTPKQATVTLIKNLVPTSDSGTFNLLVNGTPVATNVGNNGTGSTSAPGEVAVTVSETASAAANLANYDTSYTCTGGITGSGSSVSITPVSGLTTTCTFTNTRKATVTLSKTANGTGTFGFVLTNLNNASDSITVSTPLGTVATVTSAKTSTVTSLIVAATVQESLVPGGWPSNPVTASCVDANGTASGNGSGNFGSLTGNTLTIPASYLKSGAQVLCTFTNTAPGTGLVLVKSVDKAAAYPGDVLTYTITYSNNSLDPLTNIVITDAVPTYTQDPSASCVNPLPSAISGCTVVTTSASVSWLLNGALSPGATGQVKISVTIQK